MEKETIIYKVHNFYDLKQNSWSGALQTLDAIEEKGLEDEFINLVNEVIGEGMEETKLNDFIWFDTDYIEEYLGVKLWD